MKLVTRSLLVCATIVFFAAVGSAATFTVNVTAESNDVFPGNGICADSAGKCSVWAAIQETDALPGADTINIPAGVYTPTVVTGSFTYNRFIIRGPVTINGAGSGSTFMQPSSPVGGSDFILELDSGANVTVNGVTFRNAAIFGAVASPITVTSAALTLNNCVVRDNVLNVTFGVKGAGIAIYGGTLVLNGTSLLNNKLNFVSATALDHVDSRGGAIYANNATVTLTNSIINGNQLNDTYSSSLPAFGAGIALAGNFNFTATSCIIAGNTANFAGSGNSIRGVGISAQATTGASTFNLTNTQVSSNTVTGSVGSFGGGVYLETTGSATISSMIDKSTIANNQINEAWGWGGGMMINSMGRAINQSVTNSTISGNLSGGYGGGIFMVNGGSASNIGAATMNLINDTISSNHAYQEGGGVYFYKYNSLTSMFQMNLYFTTVANNVANWGTAGATTGGGGIATFGNLVNLKNSVIANNTVGNGGYPLDLQGSFYSQWYNHVGAIGLATISNTSASDGFGTVTLGPLQNNGGPTYTQLPTFGPLADQIPLGINGCGTSITKDQRGLVRPANLTNNRCDKGAVEW